MVHEELQEASDELRQASEKASSELQERLYDQSNQIANLATSERGPDQGRLDRHMNVLREILEETDEDVREHVEEAQAKLLSYRETVGGV